MNNKYFIQQIADIGQAYGIGMLTAVEYLQDMVSFCTGVLDTKPNKKTAEEAKKHLRACVCAMNFYSDCERSVL